MTAKAEVPNPLLRGWLLATMPAAAFAVAYVLLSFVEFPTPTGDLLRPIGVIAAACLAFGTALWLLTRRSPWSGVVLSGLVVGLSAPFVLIPVVVAAAAWALFRRLRRTGDSPVEQSRAVQAANAVGVFAGAFLLVGAVVAGPAIVASYFSGPPAHLQERTTTANSNVYLLVLDGYPRADTLASMYGYDNSPFLAALEKRSFRVSTHSHSNYPHTWLTFTSMLNGAYIEDLPGLEPAPQSAIDQYRALMTALNRARALQPFRDAGYEIVGIPSPFHSVALQTADRTVEGGTISAFEYSLLTHSQLSPLLTNVFPDFFMAQQRSRFRDVQGALASIAMADGPPRFVLGHLFSPPHAPLVFGRHGEELRLPDCVPDSCALWEFPPDAWDHLPEQLEYLNGQLLATLDRMIAADPSATIILMSDHGSRRDRTNLDEFFHSFFAARTTGAPFPDDISPVNVLSWIAPGSHSPRLLPYRAWMFADEIRPLELTPMTPSP
jgi:hypothetical protein